MAIFSRSSDILSILNDYVSSLAVGVKCLVFLLLRYLLFDMDSTVGASQREDLSISASDVIVCGSDQHVQGMH